MNEYIKLQIAKTLEIRLKVDYLSVYIYRKKGIGWIKDKIEIHFSH